MRGIGAEMREGKGSLFYGQRLNGLFVLPYHFEIFLFDLRSQIFQEQKNQRIQKQRGED